MQSPRENPERTLILEPNELRFSGPLVRPSITLVTLKNPNKFDVMYKFKTTAPRIYRVRPNLGVVHSNGVSTVRIVLMPFAFELKERLVHKFMVLTAPAPKFYDDIRKAWAELDEEKLWCEKFRSIIEMGLPISPHQVEQIEISPSNTSAEYNFDQVNSCGGDTSQSEGDLHHQNPFVQPKELEKPATMLSHFPAMDQERKFKELTNENNKLREQNEALRRENLQLVMELERFRDLKAEMELRDPNKKSGNGNKFMLFLATSVTMAIVCTVIGKCIFSDRMNMDGLQNFIESMVY